MFQMLFFNKNEITQIASVKAIIVHFSLRRKRVQQGVKLMKWITHN